MIDIHWIIEDDVRVRTDGVTYQVVSLDNMKHANLTFKDGRLTFSGEDIETEEFMTFVGLMDQVDDSPCQDVIFKGEDEVHEFKPYGISWERI